MTVVEPVVGAEEKGFPRLTLKDKVLLQMGEHRCEPDCAEYPFELTQKGLSEYLGARRSHIAASMKGLLDDKLIELHKGHIEGENRQQNAYLLTPKGREKANALRERIAGETVELDKDGDIGKLTIDQALKTTNLGLASILKQLDHGGPLKDERTVITKPGPQLIQIYCPTCKRNFEVENIYGDEEAGFDCPGCARPYRVVPAQKELSVGGPRPMKTSSRRIIRASGVIVTMILLGFIGLVFWNYLIIAIDFQQELEVFLVLAMAIALGYVGLPKNLAQIRGEYLLTAGLVMVLIAIALPFVRDMEGLTMASVPFLALLGTTAIILSSFDYIDRETQLLDVLVAAGILTVFVSIVQLFPERTGLLDDLKIVSLVVLGGFMMSLRFVQANTSVSVGDQFVYSAALSVGLLFGVLGAFMIWGDSPVAGIAEIVLVSPFVYFGVRKVFSSEWMYRVPIVAYMGFVEVLVLADAFLT